MSEDKTKGALVVPLWKSASFWPMLCSSGTYFDDFVKGVVYLPTQKDFYLCGKSYESMFGNVDLNFSMLCLKIDFNQIHMFIVCFYFTCISADVWK